MLLRILIDVLYLLLKISSVLHIKKTITQTLLKLTFIAISSFLTTRQWDIDNLNIWLAQLSLVIY